MRFPNIAFGFLFDSSKHFAGKSHIASNSYCKKILLNRTAPKEEREKMEARGLIIIMVEFRS